MIRHLGSTRIALPGLLLASLILSGRDLIHNNLARDLASRDAQAADLNRTLTGLGEALNLSGAQLSQVEKRYVPLRSRRVQTALVALESDPPDYLAAFDEALDLYQETDAMVRDMYGGGPRDTST